MQLPYNPPNPSLRKVKPPHLFNYLLLMKSKFIKISDLENEHFKNKTDFEQVTEKSQGGIIGTAFVKILLENKDWKEKAEAFIKSIK